MHYIAYDPALFINGKRSVAESDTEDRKYLCRFHPCNEILKRLYEIFETSKKQDLTPPCVLCMITSSSQKMIFFQAADLDNLLWRCYMF